MAIAHRHEIAGHAHAGEHIRARLGSLLAVVPLGVWTVIHLWDNLAAWTSGAAWEASVTGHRHPAAMVTSFVVVMAPLLIHTAWGIGRLLTSRPNNLRVRTFGNFKYLLQRVSAVGVLLFLGAHVWLAFLQPRLVLGHAETFEDISREMRHHGPTLAVYVLGTLGVAYHLANGIFTFSMGWGLTVSQAALRRVERGSFALFVILLAMSWGAIYALWRAGA
jgi:succinate dehydrogenase / fumarate reductase, cytochrome b subunit